jgi:ABC-type transport system involved in multi-copper enzyme maturation permease subunit
MGESRAPAGAPELLYYRPWRGSFRGPSAGIWPIARVALGLMLRRRLFWGIYGLGLVIFAMFFFGQYLLNWAVGQMGEGEVDVGGFGKANPQSFVDLVRALLKVDGSGEGYRVFFVYQIFVVVILLALAGSVVIGNDLHFGSLSFYLSKPLSRRQYLLGKGLAVAIIINLLTTLPALVLFVQNGLNNWYYFVDHVEVLVGILGYGAVLTVSLTLILLATATWLRRTVPLVMAWATLFFFCRLLAEAFVQLRLGDRWRLIDLWGDAAVIGAALLRASPPASRGPLASWQEAALVLGGVSLSCLIYLILRIRAVEIVR